jgi:hypothetical protein
MVRVGLFTLGLAGAVYAADQVAEAPPANLAQTVKTQRAGEGRRLTPEEIEHQRETLTAAQMVELALKYQVEMSAAQDHAEAVRILAYQSRDIIRITCIDDKLGQMKEVIKIAQPRFLTNERVASEDLHLRQHFIIVQQARERVAELAIEVDSCVGDNVDSVSYGRVKEGRLPIPAGENVFDPTRPPEPSNTLDRPGEASPYR